MRDRLPVFPLQSQVDTEGHLVIGGCDVVDLAGKYGTPLYLFDENTLRGKMREFKEEFGKRYPGIRILYAGKAYINGAMARIVNDEGLGLEVVSGGELGIARSVDFPMDNVYFTGNNKSRDELELALKYRIGRIVVDNFHELEMLGKLLKERKTTQAVVLRMTPGVDPHTHQYTSTGTIDSKFGFPLPLKEEAVAAAMKIPGLNLMGLHFHIGSAIFETEPYVESVRFILGFAAEMRKKYGFELKELDTGGGFGIQYTIDSPAPPLAAFAEALTSNIIKECRRLKMDLPKLTIEPGRSIVARAGVALYTVGVVKEIPGIRTYVSVDGGMADNIRPALYGARLEAVIASRMKAKSGGVVTICGKFCESGDILIKDIQMPTMKAGDIVAVAGCGAYSIPESMNYNAFCRPPVVLVKNGKSRMIRRRETLEDLTRCDIV
jgi:diaminopimelate decarboxylase